MRTKRTVVLLISGLAGSGKSTIANVVLNKLSTIKDLRLMNYSFAEPIKFIAKSFFLWDGQKDEKGRKLLQTLGKDGRDYDIDIWVKHLINQMNQADDPYNFVVIDDWRFPNEKNYLKNVEILDVVTLRIFGRGGLSGEVASDISETSLPESLVESLDSPNWNSNELYNFTLNNSVDFVELNAKLGVILAEISKQYIVE